MSRKHLNTLQKAPIKERGRKVVEHPATSKANVPNKEVTNMPFEHEYGDSADNFNDKFSFAYSCLDTIKAGLGADGFWPSSAYRTKRGSLPPIMAVYCLLWVPKYDPKVGLVAYVGATKNLQQRASGHRSKCLIPIDHCDIWCRPSERSEYLSIESRLIRKYDPPWNINERGHGSKWDRRR